MTKANPRPPKVTPRQKAILKRAAENNGAARLYDSYDVRAANNLADRGEGIVTWHNFKQYFWLKTAQVNEDQENPKS